MNIKIGKKIISGKNPCFIVAEIGVNHNGSPVLARKMILAARKAGADAVKFQTWKTENIILKDVKMADYQKENLGGVNESQFEMIKKLELPFKYYPELKKLAEKLGLVLFSTMEDKESIDFLVKKLKIPLIKVGSGDITNYPLLKYTARFKKPMVLSTGTTTMAEIEKAVKTVKKEGNNNIVLLQCTAEYPCPIKDANVKAMLTLKEKFKTIVGFSDHAMGQEAALAAVALGAKYLERHFTLNRNLPGPDQKASLEPEEFKKMVRAVRNVEIALGSGIKKPTVSESETKKLIIRKIVASQDIKKGEILNEKNITFKRAEGGLTTDFYKFIEGKRAKKEIRLNELINLKGVS